MTALVADQEQEVLDPLQALGALHPVAPRTLAEAGLTHDFVTQLVLSLGVRVPYNRFVHGVLDFLRDTADPYLRIFRRLPLHIGPLDLSPIVAIFVLQIVGGIVVGLIDP